MASSINASTAGAGGVITTADNSGVLQVQTAGTTALTITNAQVANFTNPITVGGSQAVNGPAFSAGSNGTQSISNTTVTKLTYAAKEFDTANCYDNTTNYRFTPNVAGYYQVTAAVQFSSAPSLIINYIYKNSSPAKSTSYEATGSSNMVTALIYCNGTTDYLEAFVYQSSGGSASVTNTTQWNYFQAVMVRGA
jgi:hypothetical protein